MKPAEAPSADRASLVRYRIDPALYATPWALTLFARNAPLALTLELCDAHLSPTTVGDEAEARISLSLPLSLRWDAYLADGDALMLNLFVVLALLEARV